MPNTLFSLKATKAKIAYSVDGTAPPEVHAPNHYPPGSDPLVLPADISAGQFLQWNGTKFIGASPAAGDPFDFWIFNTLLESLDQWTQSTSGGGAITINVNYLEIRTGTTAGGRAYVWKAPSLPPIAVSWAKNRKLRFYGETQVNADANAENYVCTGMGLPSDYGFGFKFLQDRIQGFAASGPGPSFVDLITGLTPGTYYYHLYEAILTAGSKVEYYIDGTKLGELTTNIPAGVSNSHIPLRLGVRTYANVQHIIRTSGCMVVQTK